MRIFGRIIVKEVLRARHKGYPLVESVCHLCIKEPLGSGVDGQGSLIPMELQEVVIVLDAAEEPPRPLVVVSSQGEADLGQAFSSCPTRTSGSMISGLNRLTLVSFQLAAKLKSVLSPPNRSVE